MLNTQNDQHSDSKNLRQDNGQELADLLLEELSTAILGYKGSLSSLSAKTKVDPKTIRKMSSGEYKRSPNADTVQRILAATSKEKSIVGIAKFYGGAIDIFLRRSYPQFFLENAKTRTEEIDQLVSKINDKYSYYVMKILSCYSRTGLNKFEFLEHLTRFIVNSEDHLFHCEATDEVLSMFRPIATQKLDYLKKIELVTENRLEGTIRLNFPNEKLIIPFELVQKYEGSLLNLSEPEYWDKLDFFSFTLHKSCSKKEVNRISRILYNAFTDCKKILKESNSTEVPVNLIASLESLNFHKKKDVK